MELPLGYANVEELRIELNSECNLRCEHCYTDKKRENVVGAAVVGDVSRSIRTLKRVSITGGEPLLDIDKLAEISEKAWMRGLLVRVNTNGVLLSDKHIARLRAAGVHELQISLSSADADNFNTFVKANVFDRVLEGMRRAVAANFYVTVRYSLANSNARYLVETYRLVAGIGVQEFKVRAVVMAVGLEGYAQTEQALIDRARNELEQAYRETRLRYKFSDPKELSTGVHANDRCGCGVSSLYLSGDGDFYSCQFLREDARSRLGKVDYSQPDLGVGAALASETNQRFLKRSTNCCTSDGSEGV
jgi:MoaA/NifB/PqqE/SkfB family radical SAM enzyme